MAASPPHPIEREYYGEDILLEEECFSWYNPKDYYPVQIGEVFKSKYQVLVKLGFGSVSTAWLCRDLDGAHRYVALKVYVTGHRQALNETRIMEHLNAIESDHEGFKLVRKMLDTFEIEGVAGTHVCMVYQPLSLTLGDIRGMAQGRLPLELSRPFLYGLLLGLDYLHSVARVIHTDIQEGNIMLAIVDESIWDEVVEAERAQPSPRKVSADRTIYSSVQLEVPDDPGPPTICDFGDAQIGDAQIGDGPFEIEVMPDLYRAPEIILGIPWNEKIDIWAFGLMIWDLVEGKHLFNERLPSRQASRPAHLSKMVALLGPPPKDLAAKAGSWEQYLVSEGTLKPDIERLHTSLEDEDEVFDGDEKIGFLKFMRKMLQWRPEDRSSAKDLLQDAWLSRPFGA